jgi:hypothetical protein
MEVDTNELLRHIGAVLHVMSDKMDRLIEIGERPAREIQLHEMLEDSGEHQADHFAGDNKMVADEPPKKWRILEPGEVVCSSDRVKGKASPPSDPPDGLGWRPVKISAGMTVRKDDFCVFARPVVDEPAKEPEHPADPKPAPGEGYRLVNDGDIGKIVEVQNSTADPWRECTLLAIDWDRPYGFLCGHVGFYRPMQWRFARIKIETPKPAWEPKVGDWVRVTRPSDWEEWDHPYWAPQMHQFDGKVGKIESEREGRFHICGFAWHGLRFVFHRDWLSPAEPPAKEPEPAKPAEPEYRQPVLPGDCGKPCEFSDDSISWEEDELIGWRANLNTFNLESARDSYRYARIKKES